MERFLLRLILFATFVSAACGGKATKNSAPSSRVNVSPSPFISSQHSLPKIVAFGDSLTVGYGLPASQTYPALLQEKLNTDGFQYEVVNAGVSGDTSAGGVRRIDWALEGDVKIVIIELGANDILRGQPISEMKRNLARIIERAKARGAEVLLAGMYSPTNAGLEYQREINDAFQSLAREHQVTLIPFFLDRVAGIESLNQADGIHPNAEGTRIVAETVYQSLRPMLEKKKPEPTK